MKANFESAGTQNDDLFSHLARRALGKVTAARAKRARNLPHISTEDQKNLFISA